MTAELHLVSEKRVSTGIAGFDEITDGGLPREGFIVVMGSAGAGKTVFALQVLANGAAHREEPGILVAFEESGERIIANTLGFVWGGPQLTKAGVHVIDARLSQTVVQGGEFDLVGLLAIVGAQAERVGARRIVFDGLDVLLAHLNDPVLIRREVFRLRDWVSERKLTALVTAKSRGAEGQLEPDYDFLQFVADCVVKIQLRVVQGAGLRFIRVAKYRGAAHSANEYPLTIARFGLEVGANTVVELAYPASTERVSTGVERLDAMLCGGYYRGSSILLTGAPGTAKTSLCVAFADAAARRGERTLYVSFDEAPDQIIRNASSIGIHLGPHVQSGLLKLQSMRARAESADGHVARIRALLRDFEPQNLVIDPLSALTQHGSEPDAEGAALHLIDLAKRASITAVCTSILGNALPLTEQTPLNISTIADTWMHVTYVSQGGERNRALTIIKARGTGHSNQVRELVLTDNGVTLADVYAVGGEVLMGTLRWEKENDELRRRISVQAATTLRQHKAELALAATKAAAATIAVEQTLREAELALIKEVEASDVGNRAEEADELLQRRHADPQTFTNRPRSAGLRTS